ncbi:hypothetical protein DL768_010681 [Monosporascus sp. mg162]|nr:hypothetical protein DL768_010681 [Monosporascus sp. mg162]
MWEKILRYVTRVFKWRELSAAAPYRFTDKQEAAFDYMLGLEPLATLIDDKDEAVGVLAVPGNDNGGGLLALVKGRTENVAYVTADEGYQMPLTVLSSGAEISTDLLRVLLTAAMDEAERLLGRLFEGLDAAAFGTLIPRLDAVYDDKANKTHRYSFLRYLRNGE